MCASAFRAYRRHTFGYYDLTAFITVVCWDSVAPPKLSGDTPVTDILKPVKISLAVGFRNKFQFACFDCINCRLCHFFHSNKPLRFDHRLYRCLTSVMGTNRMCNIFDTTEIALCIKICDNLLSCLITVKAGIFAAKFVDGTIIIHHIDLRQIMSLTNLKIIRVMGRRNLNSTCTFILIRM